VTDAVVHEVGRDLLFHGIGMLIPQVGASYDIAQGTMRAGAAAANPMNYMNRFRRTRSTRAGTHRSTPT